MKSIVVLYHSNCLDGFSSAWVAWKKFGDKASYIPTEPQTLPKVKIKNKEIYIVDLGFSKKDIKKLIKDKNFVTIIDHHLSARDDIKTASQWYFDLNHSASVLTWQYFYPNKKLPKLLKYVEDIDLWLFKLPYTEEILASIQFLDQNFKNWEKLVKDFEDRKRIKKYIAEGKIILSYQNKVVDIIVSRANLVYLAGNRVLAVNSSILNSEIGNVLARKKPPFSIVWYQSKDKIRVSLRSRGRFDVSKIAKKFGGGGHQKAAGFSIPVDKKPPWKNIKND